MSEQETIDALRSLSVRYIQGYDDRFINSDEHARVVIAAIRGGGVPGLCLSADLERCRADKDHFRYNYENAVEAHRQALSDLTATRAKVGEVTAERDLLKALCDERHVAELTDLCNQRQTAIGELIRERDQALARAERAEGELGSMGGKVTEACALAITAQEQLSNAMAKLAEAEARDGVMRELLGELTATVRGESPRLLNEDSGGNADLSIRIDAALGRGAGEKS